MKHSLPKLVSALKASYEPFSLYINTTRQFKPDAKDEIDALVENRNFLYEFYQVLEGSKRFQYGWGKYDWEPTAADVNALRAAVDEIRKKRGSRLSQGEMFAIDDAIREAVKLGIVVPRAEAVKQEFIK
jgi:hypothetical protein